MKFRFVIPVYDSTRCDWYARDSVHELTEGQARLFAGKGLDHLEGMDAAGSAFIDRLRAKPSAEPVPVEAKTPGVKPPDVNGPARKSSATRTTR